MITDAPSASRRDTLEPFAIVVPLERSVPRRHPLGRTRDLRVPLFVLLGLPAIAGVGALIGCVVTALM